MAKKYLDSNGLSHFWTKIKAYITSVLPVASSTTPKMDGTATTGSETAFAKGDHIHPTDTSRAPTSHASSGTTYGKGTNGNYGHVKLSDATAGTEAAASGGTAATPKAVKDALDAAKSYADGLDTGVSDVTVDGTSVVNNGTAILTTPTSADIPLDTPWDSQIDTVEEALNLLDTNSSVQVDWNESDVASLAYIKNKPTIPSGVSPSTTTPKMDGTAAVGTETKFARGDHVHPSDTSKADGNGRIFYGTCSTAAGTSEKAVACDDYDDYIKGDVLVVYFSVGNTAQSQALNVNSKGAKTIKQFYNGGYTNIKSPTILYHACVFAYDGTYWILLNADTDTTYSNATTSAAGLMSTTDKGKVDKLVFDSNNLIDSSILPSYVDDVIEAYPRSGATELSSTWLSLTSGGSALTPETGKIYVLMADSTSYAANSQFRWSGTAYVKLADGGVSEITTAEIDTIVAS